MTKLSTSKVQMQDGQLIESWGTVGIYDGGLTVYGGFPTRKKAEEWLSKLQSGAVIPIYSEAYNRG